MLQLFPLPAFKDNYIWALTNGQQALVVDPGDSAVATQWLEQQQLTLHTLLITHHHADHTAGLAALKARTQAQTFGPDEVTFAIDHTLAGGETLNISPFGHIHVIAVPGHTRAHLSYYLPEHKLLFCGDTLFSAGCGRIFEGTAAQMFDSLSRLAQLPDDTQICPAHEYTLANLRFAQHVEPDNPALQQRLRQVENLREQGKPSLPITIGEEKTYNPFLRCHLKSITQPIEKHTKNSLNAPFAVFAALRAWKDVF